MVSWRVPPRLRGVRKGPNRYPGVVDLAFEGREVLLFERFLSWDECDHIMATAGLDAGDTGEGKKSTTYGWGADGGERVDSEYR